MKILALGHELQNVPGKQFRQYARDEARNVWELYQAGVIREMDFRADRHEAVLMWESASVTDAREALLTLPFAQDKPTHFEILPWKAYDGFERLSDKDSK